MSAGLYLPPGVVPTSQKPQRKPKFLDAVRVRLPDSILTQGVPRDNQVTIDFYAGARGRIIRIDQDQTYLVLFDTPMLNEKDKVMEAFDADCLEILEEEKRPARDPHTEAVVAS